MPTYAYRCASCSHQFDAVQKFSDAPLTTCPECGQEVRRVFQPVGIVFKGSGWYINDSRGSDKSSGSEKAAADSKPSADSAPATSDKTGKKSADTPAPEKSSKAAPTPAPASAD